MTVFSSLTPGLLDHHLKPQFGYHVAGPLWEPPNLLLWSRLCEVLRELHEQSTFENSGCKFDVGSTLVQQPKPDFRKSAEAYIQARSMKGTVGVAPARYPTANRQLCQTHFFRFHRKLMAWHATAWAVSVLQETRPNLPKSPNKHIQSTVTA